ncbi:hypothetical protein AAC387_Pa02g0621 [Persea americana]
MVFPPSNGCDPLIKAPAGVNHFNVPPDHRTTHFKRRHAIFKTMLKTETSFTRRQSRRGTTSSEFLRQMPKPSRAPHLSTGGRSRSTSSVDWKVGLPKPEGLNSG